MERDDYEHVKLFFVIPYLLRNLDSCIQKNDRENINTVTILQRMKKYCLNIIDNNENNSHYIFLINIARGKSIVIFSFYFDLSFSLTVLSDFFRASRPRSISSYVMTMGGSIREVIALLRVPAMRTPLRKSSAVT